MKRRLNRTGALICLAAWTGALAAHGEEKRHTGEILFGYDQNEGNSDTIGFEIGGAHRWVAEGGGELHSKAGYAYGEADGVRKVNRGNVSSDYDRHIRERLYTNIRAEALFDAPAEIDHRVIVGPPSVGYDFIETERRSLSGELGLAYLWEKVADVKEEGPVLRAKQEFERHVGKNARFWQSFEYLPYLSEFDRFLLHTIVGIESGLTEVLFMRFVVTDRYDSDPGVDLKKNDLNMTASLAVKF